MATGSDLAVHQDVDILSNVKDKIRAEFVNLVPDEQWQAMVKAAVDDWFERKKEPAHNDREWSSDFTRFVQELLREECREKIKEYFNTPEWQGQWRDGKQIASDKVAEIVVDNADKIIGELVGYAIQNVVRNMQNHF